MSEQKTQQLPRNAFKVSHDVSPANAKALIEQHQALHQIQQDFDKEVKALAEAYREKAAPVSAAIKGVWLDIGKDAGIKVDGQDRWAVNLDDPEAAFVVSADEQEELAYKRAMEEMGGEESVGAALAIALGMPPAAQGGEHEGKAVGPTHPSSDQPS